MIHADCIDISRLHTNPIPSNSKLAFVQQYEQITPGQIGWPHVFGLFQSKLSEAFHATARPAQGEVEIRWGMRELRAGCTVYMAYQDL